MINYEEEILKLIKQKKEVSTSRIQGELGINYYKLKLILSNIKSIKSFKKGNYTYWRMR